MPMSELSPALPAASSLPPLPAPFPTAPLPPELLASPLGCRSRGITHSSPSRTVPGPHFSGASLHAAIAAATPSPSPAQYRRFIVFFVTEMALDRNRPLCDREKC